MALFTGEYECKLDAKGRLTLPSKVKSRLPEVSGNQLVLSKGLETCIVVYPQVEYMKIYARIASLSEFNEEYRELQRNLFRRIADVDLDSVGRILIPRQMTHHAGLQKQVIIVGLGNRFEIWDADTYNENIIKDNEAFSKLVQKHLTE